MNQRDIGQIIRAENMPNKPLPSQEESMAKSWWQFWKSR
jgi:hypothetical protein